MRINALLLLLIPWSLAAQSVDSLDIVFTRRHLVPVADSGRQLLYPWVGGMNAVQFSQVDLDLDGTDDLIVFDRLGNILMPFLNQGIPDSIQYAYAPEYIAKLPPFNGWVLFRDYNMDGKQDIFTYSVGGMAVYRNDSDTALRFTLMTFLLNSFYYINYINIYVTYADYPGIYDIDMDGDLDILTFYVVGSFIEYHRNMSMEKYGVPDSLDFTMYDRCWGLVYESEGSNVLTLNMPCPFRDCDEGGGAPRTGSPEAIEHVGSTLLPINLNGDSLTDLILGDVDYSMVIALINGGTQDTALMVSQDTLFPGGTRPIRLTSFPALSYFDLDNDNVNELVVSPFDPSPIITENFRSVWLYENDGQNDLPDFRYVTDRWLQGDMIDLGAGAYPVVVDENADGLPDIIAGNFGYRDSSWFAAGTLYSSFRSTLTLLRNTGTPTQPSFEIVDRDYTGIAALGIKGAIPAFGDLDGDLDLDLLLGSDDGTFIFLKNLAGPGQPFLWDTPVLNYQGLDAGRASAPCIVDMDRDGLPDLVSGNKTGRLSWYRNTGTSNNPQFTLLTDSMGYVDVADYSIAYDGYSVPSVWQDSTDTLRLYVGSLSGRLAYYRAGPDPLDSFRLVSKAFQLIDDGDLSGPGLGDLDGDGVPELLLGNYRGGVTWFSGYKAAPSGLMEPQGPSRLELLVFPNPAGEQLYFRAAGLDPAFAIQVAVHDLAGRRLLQRTILPGDEPGMPVGELVPGAYLLSLNYTGASRILGTALFIKK
ncbi:MAG TPA: VCBS repeat-containing protein [Bacteroidales bacterium]|nr:VCBS repeat-containing protein [Bacteroidales bacterium]